MPTEISEIVLTVDDVLKMIRNLMKFPFPQICRHAVALDLISILEEKGWNPPNDLVKAVTRAWDDIALEELAKLEEQR